MSRFRATVSETAFTGRFDLIGTREYVDVVVPRTSIKGRMRLVSRTEVIAIKAETRKAFITLGLATEVSIVSLAVEEWNAEIAVRHLAIAVRDPDDVTAPLASLDEWRECDDEQIGALWIEYQDMRDRLDPLGQDSVRATADDLTAMREASKKKEYEFLMSYGSRKLAACLISMAEEPAS